MRAARKTLCRPVPGASNKTGRSALQRRADSSVAVAQLTRLQGLADSAAHPLLQFYRHEAGSAHGETFIPAGSAAIHCHVGNAMRAPHLKIRGRKYNFGNPHDLGRMQDALNALVEDPAHARMEGYDDCVEYLIEQGCVMPEDVEEEAPLDQRPMSAYDDPSTSRASRRLIERGLAAGRYPPP